MAKVDLGGVWRTVGGRRIFIKDGEDLETAMKESGKFKKSEIKDKDKDKNKKEDVKEKETNNEDKIKELEEKLENAKGFLEKAKIKEEIDALKKGYKNVEEYRKISEEKREKAVKEANKEREERKKYIAEQKRIEEENGYKMFHRPNEDGATGDDITKGDVSFPKDFYDKPQNYGNMNDKTFKESFEALKSIKGNPDKEITIYRATTGDTINDGDWITLSKEYANIHNQSNLNGQGKILELKVKASEIRFAGDDINEFGYFPKKKKK